MHNRSQYHFVVIFINKLRGNWSWIVLIFIAVIVFYFSVYCICLLKNAGETAGFVNKMLTL